MKRYACLWYVLFYFSSSLSLLEHSTLTIQHHLRYLTPVVPRLHHHHPLHHYHRWIAQHRGPNDHHRFRFNLAARNLIVYMINGIFMLCYGRSSERVCGVSYSIIWKTHTRPRSMHTYYNMLHNAHVGAWTHRRHELHRPESTRTNHTGVIDWGVI